MKRITFAVGLIALLSTPYVLATAPVVIQQPGTQPLEVSGLETPDKCDNCHGGYDQAVEPAYNWRGSMMAHAGRDPVFWATMAISEQDFAGAGDFCLRCHSPSGWLAGRAELSDGSGLHQGDADGVECDFCHSLTNPDNTELHGVMNAPYIANDAPTSAEGYYGSGMASVWGASDKLGPYGDAEARHKFIQSRFHRSADFCGTCHDISNPAVGNLSANHGTLGKLQADMVNADGVLDGSVDSKAAFNNPPYRYGIVERTFSEYKASLLPQLRVSNYPDLPADLQGGALEYIYQTAGGDYQDGSPRYFTCQTCHLRPVTGYGANKRGIPLREDLPLHDMTGGNYWAPAVIHLLDTAGNLRLGGGMTEGQIAAMMAGAQRAKQQLNLAASLSVSANTVKVVNHTGHKLISGYPEGRRMWLNIKWYNDDSAIPIREDGQYGDLTLGYNPLVVNGEPLTVRTLLDLEGRNTKIYQANYGISKEWAQHLLSLGYPADMAVSYDRVTGMSDYSLGDVVNLADGSAHESFHFALNNTVIRDNRIPPYGMDYNESAKRNVSPVPASQYGGTSGTYQYWDEVILNPPADATYATIDLLYQPTSWEYIQFLALANNKQNAFLAQEGDNLLSAWYSTGMAEPYVMASTTWGTTPSGQEAEIEQLITGLLIKEGKGKNATELFDETYLFTAGDSVVIRGQVLSSDIALIDAVVTVSIGAGADSVLADLSAVSDSDGQFELVWQTTAPNKKGQGGTEPGDYDATVTDVITSEGNELAVEPENHSVSFTVSQ